MVGSGKAQSPLPLQHGRIYYATLRAITGNDDVLSATSDGVLIDTSSPKIELLDLGFPTENETNLVRQGFEPEFSTGTNPWLKRRMHHINHIFTFELLGSIGRSYMGHNTLKHIGLNGHF